MGERYFYTYKYFRIANHMKHVTSAHINKQSYLDEIEEKNTKEYQDWLAEKERREKEERQKALQEMHTENKKIFDKEKTSKREQYQKMVEQRKKEEDDYKGYLKRQAEEDKNRRKLYRDALEYQKGYQDYNKKHLGQMTKMEKMLNKHDLKTFKNGKVEYEGMIPGINNIASVGSKPLLRVANDDLYDTSKNAPQFVTKELNKSYKDLRTSLKPLEDFTQTKQSYQRDRYDPITNPIPFVNQNPYITKEKTLIGGEGSSSVVHTHRGSRRSLLSSTAEKNILI